MLAHSEVARYLLDRALISRAHLLDEGLRIVDVSRRNRIFKVNCGPDHSYLLKQALHSEGIATVAHEATVYEFFATAPEALFLRSCVPRYYGYDASNNILILEFMNNAVDFREYHMRRGHFSTTAAALLGLALSNLHNLPLAAVQGSSFKAIARQIPWVLSLQRPKLDIFKESSNANLQLIRIIQKAPAFARLLDALHDGWRVDALTHNDIKWDNCLVFPRSSSSRKLAVKIVDWEFTRPGDSAWDVGSVFSNYLSFWLFSVPLSGEEPPARYLDLAQYPLERMQPAMRACWQAYVHGIKLDASRSEQLLLRAMRYAAARLVQAGFEQMQHSPSLTGNIVCLLQLSLNIMHRPYEAIGHLLGISLKPQG